VIQTLLERRVPQLTGLYIVAAWGFLQFVDWAVDQYTLSPALIDFVVTALLVLLPMIVVLAWRHGAPGADAWTKVDAAVIGLNLIAAGGLLLLVFSGQELGAATTVRLLEDDDGNTVERVIPKASFRRDVLVWDFDNETGNPEFDWLQTGMVIGITADLAQDMFVTTVEASNPRVREPIEEAGFERPVGLPLTLKRQGADRLSLGHFLDGTLDLDGDTLVVETRLYETHSARQVAAHTYRGTDPLEISDRISVDLRRGMGIPDWQIAESVDLPAAEIISESPQALRALSEGQQLYRANDMAASRVKMEEAAALDSTSAVALLGVGQLSLLMGDQQAARESFAGASRYAYRLPERMQLSVRVMDQLLLQADPEAALRTGRYWTEIYPQDAAGRQLLAAIYGMKGDTDGQIVQYRALLAIDSNDVESMSGLAAAFRAKEEYDSALVYYARLGELQPGDVDTHLNIAATLTSLVKFDQAREQLERARVAAPDEPDVLNRIARLDMREGRYEDAARRVERVSSLARTPQQRYAAAGLEETLYYERGQFGRLADAYRRRLEAAIEHLPPIQAVGAMAASEYLIHAVDARREADALWQLDSLRSSVEAPWSSTTDRAAVRIHLDTGDIQAARESLDGLRALVDAFGAAPVRTALNTWVEGRIAALEDGDCRRALDSYDVAHELVPRSSLYRAWRARCLTTLERWDEAKAEIGWLLERFPGSAKFRLDAARLYAGQGRTADAVAEAEAALDIWSLADPDFRPAREARAFLEELGAAG
jgi:tetratricopeptide (TPR) repeat protein/TolB-like protein